MHNVDKDMVKVKVKDWKSGAKTLRKTNGRKGCSWSLWPCTSYRGKSIANLWLGSAVEAAGRRDMS